MKESNRYITKIARDAYKYVLKQMKPDGIGTGEFDFIHMVRHHPGITQAAAREQLKIDKGAAARRTASLEAKGYLIREDNPDDRRSQRLYATEKAELLRNSKVSLENNFYEWLFSGLASDDAEAFERIIIQLYERSKSESRSGFLNVKLNNGKGD